VHVRISNENISGKTDNILQKKMSRSEFHFFLIKHKWNLLNKNILRRIMAKFEKDTLSFRSIKIHEWLILLNRHLRILDLKGAIYLIRRILIITYK
jgi:hypothetical protein